MLNLSAHDVLNPSSNSYLDMTTLNRRLQLAMLNSKKSKNALQKGFTLVELMIVIVIVGVLSSVALPSFLNQRAKAEATEAVQKISVLLRDAVTEIDGGQSGDTIQKVLTASVAGSATNADENFTYSIYDGGSDNTICVVATGKIPGTAGVTGGSQGTANKYVVGWIKDGSRKPQVKSTLLTIPGYVGTGITTDATCLSEAA